MVQKTAPPTPLPHGLCAGLVFSGPAVVLGNFVTFVGSLSCYIIFPAQ